MSQFSATYPGASFFHTPVCAINNYCDHTQVRFCQLDGLNDLASETEPVRAKIAAYLSDLLTLGVNGFRCDASKHMWPEDLKSIMSRLPQNSKGTIPDVFQEVIEGSSCEVSPTEYFDTTANSRITEFRYAPQLAGKISGNLIADAVTFKLGESWGMLPNNKAVVFVDNHDTERNNAPFTYKSGWKYFMSVAFMMAWPYGYPKVLSSFEFLDPNAGPPYSGNVIADNDCLNPNGNLWTCTHRFRPIAATALWRAVTSGSDSVDNIFTQGGTVVGYTTSPS